jgi:GMP synthase-like glutamine amidotransferase
MKPDLLIVKHSSSFGPGLIERVLNERDIMYDTADLTEVPQLPALTDYRAVVCLDGFGSANDPKWDTELARIKAAVERRIPFLGIGLGMQLLVKSSGGQVVPAAQKEAGFYDSNNQFYVTELTLEGLKDPIFRGLSAPMQVFQLHTETAELGQGTILLAKSNVTPNQVIKVGDGAYGFQPHLELTEPMLRALSEEDPLLQPIGAQKLLDTFARVRATYTTAGLTLFRNWLAITGLN